MLFFAKKVAFVYNINMKILCPNCKSLLIEEAKLYRCQNNHCFDKAKEGYTNLILSNQKRSKNPGDNMDMVKARQEFLAQGYYEKLSQEINKLVQTYHAENILDIGACDGYYTHRLDKHLMYPHSIVGVDISKDSLKLASRRDDNCRYFVSSVKSLPIKSGDVDIIINNFAPHDETEFLRVLKDGGRIIKITPAPSHLLGLKEKLFDNVIIKSESKKLQGFEINKDYVLEYDIQVEGENIINLLKMTPFYYKTNFEEQAKLKELKTLNTKVAFNITVYQKKK